MQIGKYRVRASAGYSDEAGGFQGSAHLTWDEGSDTCVQTIHFDKVLPTGAEAELHAIEQIEIRVKQGVL